MDNEIITSQAAADTLTVNQVIGQIQQVHSLMKQAMKENEHYGVIPGTKGKPTLLKAGAEKLCLMFRLAPDYAITRREASDGHVEYEIVCHLRHIPTGNMAGSGVGLCSTMEIKYRYRGGSRKCPECGKEAIKKSKYPPRGRPHDQPGFYCFAKIGGCGKEFAHDDQAIVGQSEERTENPDLADTYNTILKMAKKRALVDACLTATAASDIFTQDMVDEPADSPEPPAPPQPVANGKSKPVAEFVELCNVLSGMGITDKAVAAAVVKHVCKVSIDECRHNGPAATKAIDELVKQTETAESIITDAKVAAGIATELEKAGAEVFG